MVGETVEARGMNSDGCVVEDGLIVTQSGFRTSLWALMMVSRGN